MNKIIFISIAVFLTLGTSCGNSKNNNNTPGNQQSVEEYQCPMKCEEKTYNKPGQCPVCEMDLEKVTKG